MDLSNVETKNLKSLTCGLCKKANKTVNKDELYCPLRMEFVKPDRVGCKKVEIDPEKASQKKEAIRESIPESKPAAKEVPGRYVWIGSDQDVIGRLIGRNGRNIDALEKATNTTVDLLYSKNWAWIGGDKREDESIATSIIFAMLKMPSTPYHPAIIEQTVQICRKGILDLKFKILIAGLLAGRPIEEIKRGEPK